MSSVIRKEDAHRLVDQLPANATWEELKHNVRGKIESWETIFIYFNQSVEN